MERRHEGEAYVAGFVGYTLGHSFANVDGTGGLSTTGIESLDLANSVAYGMKVGYFLPTRKLNWLGFELEAIQHHTAFGAQNGFAIGSNLRVATVALNVIARKRMACDDRDRHDRTRRVTAHEKDGTTVQDEGWSGMYDYDKDGRHYDDDWSPEAENARCPLQVYAGAGPAIFFARTSNQIGSSSENGEVGVNALAGVKYFVHRNVSIFGEYKFNYAGFDFTEFATPGWRRAASRAITRRATL